MDKEPQRSSGDDDFALVLQGELSSLDLLTPPPMREEAKGSSPGAADEVPNPDLVSQALEAGLGASPGRPDPVPVPRLGDALLKLDAQVSHGPVLELPVDRHAVEAGYVSPEDSDLGPIVLPLRELAQDTGEVVSPGRGSPESALFPALLPRLARSDPHEVGGDFIAQFLGNLFDPDSFPLVLFPMEGS